MTDHQRFLRSPFKLLILVSFLMLVPVVATAQVWTVAAGDPKGDVRDPSLADAAQLTYRFDKQLDFLWFRVALYGVPNDQAFGVNVAVDTGAEESVKTDWWGANKAFRFDKLVTAWVTRNGNGYQGTIGVGDAAGVNMKKPNNLRQNNLQIKIDGDAILIGVKRTDITDKMKMKFIVAVGSNQNWNDDIPNTGSVAVDLSAEKPARGLREIDLGRNNLMFAPDYKTLAAGESSSVARRGRGKLPVILVPGMFSGATSFEGFIARNQSRYKFYIVTPPGINGTRARPMPPAGSSFGELTWTHSLERDILALIRKENLFRPLIVAESHPASIAAIDLAVDNPEEVGGVVISGTNLVQFFPSPKDPTRKTSVTLQERAVSIDQGWVAKWFKFVTPETWNSNDVSAEMLSNNPARGQKASQEIESAPLPVKIRFLCEFWASDVTLSFDKLRVPVMVLIPGFDDKFLSDPANSFAKTTYVDSWETVVPKHPMLELVKIPDARLLILDDQPQQADDAIASFVERVRKTKP